MLLLCRLVKFYYVFFLYCIVLTIYFGERTINNILPYRKYEEMEISDSSSFSNVNIDRYENYADYLALFKGKDAGL